jgi:hypothetical protein
MNVYKIKTMFFYPNVMVVVTGKCVIKPLMWNIYIYIMLNILYVKCKVWVYEAILFKHYLVTLFTNSIAVITMAL